MKARFGETYEYVASLILSASQCLHALVRPRMTTSSGELRHTVTDSVGS